MKKISEDHNEKITRKTAKTMSEIPSLSTRNNRSRLSQTDRATILFKFVFFSNLILDYITVEKLSFFSATVTSSAVNKVGLGRTFSVISTLSLHGAP